MANSERQRQVREGLAMVRRFEAERGDMPIENDGVRPWDLAEILALLAAEARACDGDEGILAEILLRSTDQDRESLRKVRAVLNPLGYTSIVDALKRLERTARPQPRWREELEQKRTEHRERMLAAHRIQRQGFGLGTPHRPRPSREAVSANWP